MAGKDLEKKNEGGVEKKAPVLTSRPLANVKKKSKMKSVPLWCKGASRLTEREIVQEGMRGIKQEKRKERENYTQRGGKHKTTRGRGLKKIGK